MQNENCNKGQRVGLVLQKRGSAGVEHGARLGWTKAEIWQTAIGNGQARTRQNSDSDDFPRCFQQMLRLTDQRRQMFFDDTPNAHVIHGILAMKDPVAKGDDARQFGNLRRDQVGKVIQRRPRK
jgi:hypothetical protein